jgi:hypothetical protein
MSAISGKFVDRVRDTAGVITPTVVNLLNTPPAAFQSFGSGYANTDTVPGYVMTDGTNWEVNYGPYNANTLGRAAVPLASSNGGAQVVAFVGTVTVASVDPASQMNMWLIGLQAGRMRVNYLALGTVNNNPALATVYYVPIFMPQWFSSIVMHFTPAALSGTATAVMDLGFYDNLNGAPNSRLVQTTGINISNTGPLVPNADNATGVLALPSPKPPGFYWGAQVCRNAAGNFRQVNAAGGGQGGRFVMGGATTATLDDLTGWTQASATLPATAAALAQNTGNATLLGIVPSF